MYLSGGSVVRAEQVFIILYYQDTFSEEIRLRLKAPSRKGESLDKPESLLEA